MYNIAFTGVVLLLIINLVELDPISQITLQAVGVLWGSFFCSFAFVLPLLLENPNNHDQRIPNTSSSRVSSTTGPDTRSKARESKAPLPHSSERVSRSRPSARAKSGTSNLDDVPEAAPTRSERSIAIETTARSNDNELTSKISYPFSTWETIEERSNDFCEVQSIESESHHL